MHYHRFLLLGYVEIRFGDISEAMTISVHVARSTASTDVRQLLLPRRIGVKQLVDGI